MRMCVLLGIWLVTVCVFLTPGAFAKLHATKDDMVRKLTEHIEKYGRNTFISSKSKTDFRRITFGRILPRELSNGDSCSTHSDCDEGEYCDEDSSCWPNIACCYFNDSSNGTCLENCDETHPPATGACNEDHEDCEDGDYCDTAGFCYPHETCCFWGDSFDGTCPQVCAKDSPRWYDEFCDENLYTEECGDDLVRTDQWQEKLCCAASQAECCEEVTPTDNDACDADHADCPDGEYCNNQGFCYTHDVCCAENDSFDGQCPESCGNDDEVLCDENTYTEACGPDQIANDNWHGDYCCASSQEECCDNPSPPGSSPCDADHGDCPDGEYCNNQGFCYTHDVCCTENDSFDGECPEDCENDDDVLCEENIYTDDCGINEVRTENWDGDSCCASTLSECCETNRANIQGSNFWNAVVMLAVIVALN